MATDMEKALKLAKSKKRYVGAKGTMVREVAEVVAKGIALGRKEGMEMASKMIAEQAKKLAD